MSSPFDPFDAYGTFRDPALGPVTTKQNTNLIAARFALYQLQELVNRLAARHSPEAELVRASVTTLERALGVVAGPMR